MAKTIRSTVATACIGFSLIAGLVACGGREPNPASTTTPGVPSTGTPSVATPLPSATPTVLRKMVDAVNRVIPEGFSLVPGNSGVLDLEGAAALSSDPSKERAALQRNGFVRAYRLLWTREDASIAVLGYEFRADAGATSYERYSVDDAVRNYGAQRFAVSGIAGATGLRFVDNPSQPSWYVRSVTFPRGSIRFGVTAGKPSDPDAESVVRLADVLEQVAA